ncbi:CLUMA_CG010772, isoform A [Clunio marinus]|uniref:CLUMA_CG010772, isoform A n=1 Tax=Clunio marinus TaxID=568069 RepID=A0A1J1IEF4_9DIPT|nr:CLUMA_CG010772, isoform A [Clunio marinus]
MCYAVIKIASNFALFHAMTTYCEGVGEFSYLQHYSSLFTDQIKSCKLLENAEKVYELQI